MEGTDVRYNHWSHVIEAFEDCSRQRGMQTGWPIGWCLKHDLEKGGKELEGNSAREDMRQRPVQGKISEERGI